MPGRCDQYLVDVVNTREKRLMESREESSYLLSSPSLLLAHINTVHPRIPIAALASHLNRAPLRPGLQSNPAPRVDLFRPTSLPFQDRPQSSLSHRDILPKVSLIPVAPCSVRRFFPFFFFFRARFFRSCFSLCPFLTFPSCGGPASFLNFSLYCDRYPPTRISPLFRLASCHNFLFFFFLFHPSFSRQRMSRLIPSFFRTEFDFHFGYTLSGGLTPQRR